MSKQFCKLAEQCGKQQPQMQSQPCASQQSLNLIREKLPPIHEEHLVPPCRRKRTAYSNQSPVPVCKEAEAQQEAQALQQQKISKRKLNGRKEKPVKEVKNPARIQVKTRRNAKTQINKVEQQ